MFMNNTFNEKFSNTIALILNNCHFNLIQWDKVAPEWKSVILQTKEKNEQKLSDREHNPKNHYSKPTYIIPFKSEHVSRKLIQFKHQLKCNHEFNVSFKTTTKIIDITKRIENAINMNTKVGPIAASTQKEEEGREHEKCGTIYKAKCKLCSMSNIVNEYIGESGRPLKTRIYEHMKPVRDGTLNLEIPSAIGAHSLLAHGEQPTRNNWNFEILATANNTQKRKLLEALAIKLSRPKLNRDVGVFILPIDYQYKFKSIPV